MEKQWEKEPSFPGDLTKGDGRDRFPEGAISRPAKKSNFFQKKLDGGKKSGIIIFAVTSDQGQQPFGEMAELVEGARLEIV